MITDVGIEALGSWEPLPTGSAFVDYWRAQLGKAERLTLGLRKCIQMHSPKRKWRSRPATKPMFAASTTPWAG
jgi:hypothetical protein